MTKRKRAGGSATDLDVERIDTLLEGNRAALVPLRAQIAEQSDRLAMLTAREPGELDAELSPPKPIPMPPAVVRVGDPATLLRRRPDIRAAERRLALSNAAIGERIADLFPKISLLGTIGFGATDAAQLFEGNSLSALVAPILQWDLLDFGRNSARIDQAEGERDETGADYRKTVLAAIADAETSLSRFARQRESVGQLALVEASANRAAGLMDLRFRGGTATTLDVLDTERQRINAETRSAEATAQLTQDYVVLQKTLGLGWNDPAR